MAWTSTLPKPLKLRDGRELKTLSDVREVFLDLPKQAKMAGNWRSTSELLMKCAAQPAFADRLQETLESYLCAIQMI